MDKRLLNFGRQLWLSESLPPGRHWPAELLKEVFDAALAAAQMVEKQTTHNPPTQARPPTQRGIDFSGADHAFDNKMINLAGKGGLQTIRDVTGHFLVQSNRPLSHGGVEL